MPLCHQGSILEGVLPRETDSPPIRLAGGTENEGRVEVFFHSTWGTICDDAWDLADARVVCRQLGYAGAVQATTGPTFGPGKGPVYLDQVSCKGNEPSLALCGHDGWRESNCDHNEDAGVVCVNGETSGWML